MNVGGEVDTTITVTIPETETRAGGSDSAEGIFANGLLTADGNNLTMRYIMQIFDSNNRPSDAIYVTYSDDPHASFDVRLVPNRHYSFVVWADVVKEHGKVNGVYSSSDDIHYNTDVEGVIDLTNITINENTWVAMDETRDAFTGVYNTAVEDDKSVYTSSKTINITLTRPFAKLRVKTTDMVALRNLGIEPHNAVVSYSTPYYTSFNALSKEYTKGNSNKTHTYEIASYADNDNENMTLFTDYLFVNNDVVKFTMAVNEANNQLIKSNDFTTDIPVQRNYLTTISGNILTDGNNIEVEVTDAFENAATPNNPPYYVEVWDGKTITEPAYNEATKTYTIKNGAELAWLAAAVNAKTRSIEHKTFEGETFVLAGDINLGGNVWTPISMSTKLSDGETFRGTFDGQGHTISGLYVNQKDVAGLFGYVYAATIKNVTIDGANLYSNHYAGGIVGWVLNSKGNIQVPFEMVNCHVKNSTISSTPEQVNGEWDNGDKVGGLVGYAHFGDDKYAANNGAKIQNCSVENTTIKAYRDFGGLIGYASHVAINNCNISNVTLEQDLSHNYKAPNTPNTFGMIIGRDNGGNTIDGNQYSYEKVADGVYTVNGNYHIFNAEGLKWVSENVNTMEFYVNQSANIFDGKTVYLVNDIDLGGAEWRPIGDYAFSRTSFNGIFDGQDYTISNFKVTEPVRWTEKATEASYGFFGNVKGTIKNLTIKNATVNPEGGRYSAALVGRLHNGGHIENCHVENSSVTILHWQVGGLVGQNNNGNISDCTVANSTITGKAAVGAIVGMDMAVGEHTIENCRVANSALVQNESFGASYDASYGLAVGLVNASGIVLNIKDVVAENNTIKGVADNTLVGDIETGATVTINGVSIATTAEQLEAAVKAGGHIVLVNNIALTKSIAISNANFTLDGNGYTITMTEDATNTYALFDITGGKAAIKNITFDGIKSGAIVRTVGVEFNAENVTAQNGQHTQQQGLFRLLGKSTVKDCTFKDNTCNMVVTLNFDVNSNDYPQIIENCVFESNTCNDTAVAYYVCGTGATINGNKFLNNTVSSSGNAATLYMGFTENNTITNNLFSGNNVTTTHATSKRATGGLMIGYEATISGNAFVNNTITAEGRQLGNDVCASVYYTDIDLSGNYWGGGAPVENDDYYKEYTNHSIIINNFLTENPIK